MITAPRVRFAPSPTGMLHAGSATVLAADSARTGAMLGLDIPSARERLERVVGA